MGKRQPKVLEADWHRNGVAGAGFSVAIVDDPTEGRMLVIDFSAEEDADYGYTAVLNLDKAASGNIYMFGTNEHAGGNAWRGDVLGDIYRPLVRAALDAKREKIVGA
jgi:hypothetical protein